MVLGRNEVNPHDFSTPRRNHRQRLSVSMGEHLPLFRVFLGAGLQMAPNLVNARFQRRGFSRSLLPRERDGHRRAGASFFEGALLFEGMLPCDRHPRKPCRGANIGRQRCVPIRDHVGCPRVFPAKPASPERNAGLGHGPCFGRGA